jgi:squalene cyclase
MMTITHATYVVKATYAAQNKSNIKRVIEDIRSLHRTDLQYSVFVQNDGKTFIHMLFCANEEAGKIFGALESFKAFQAALAESQPEVLPSVTDPSLVGSTLDFFA